MWIIVSKSDTFWNCEGDENATFEFKTKKEAEKFAKEETNCDIEGYKVVKLND